MNKYIRGLRLVEIIDQLLFFNVIPDIVKGKREGLIILLYGPFNISKTSTAEIITEVIKRPLLFIICGK